MGSPTAANSQDREVSRVGRIFVRLTEWFVKWSFKRSASFRKWMLQVALDDYLFLKLDEMLKRQLELKDQIKASFESIQTEADYRKFVEEHTDEANLYYIAEVLDGWMDLPLVNAWMKKFEEDYPETEEFLVNDPIDEDLLERNILGGAK